MEPSEAGLVGDFLMPSTFRSCSWSGFRWFYTTTFTVGCSVQAAPCTPSCAIHSGAVWELYC